MEKTPLERTGRPLGVNLGPPDTDNKAVRLRWKYCKWCRQAFRPQSNDGALRWQGRRFCSSKCHAEHQSRDGTSRAHSPFKQCEHCSGLILAHQNQSWWQSARFCSVVCRSAVMRGEQGANWRGGKTVNRRKLVEYKEWRNEVLKRDNYTCQGCGKRGGQLQSDHILPWSIYKDLRYSVENGRAMCPPCHKRLGANPVRKSGIQPWL